MGDWVMMLTSPILQVPTFLVIQALNMALSKAMLGGISNIEWERLNIRNTIRLIVTPMNLLKSVSRATDVVLQDLSTKLVIRVRA